ncbi:hypothetical protein CYMTET_45567, partial [Cymbomonas tetramitiformis]
MHLQPDPEGKRLVLASDRAAPSTVRRAADWMPRSPTSAVCVGIRPHARPSSSSSLSPRLQLAACRDSWQSPPGTPSSALPRVDVSHLASPSETSGKAQDFLQDHRYDGFSSQAFHLRRHNHVKPLQELNFDTLKAYEAEPARKQVVITSPRFGPHSALQSSLILSSQKVGESEDYLVPETLRDKLSSDARLEAIYQEQLKEVEQLNLEEKLAKAWKPPEVIEKVKKKESRLLQSRVDRRSELQCIETTRRMVALLVGLLVAILAVVAQFECTPTTDDDWYKECGYVELCSQRRNEEPYNCRWVKDPLHHPEDGLTLDAQYENLIQSEILANLIYPPPMPPPSPRTPLHPPPLPPSPFATASPVEPYVDDWTAPNPPPPPPPSPPPAVQLMIQHLLETQGKYIIKFNDRAPSFEFITKSGGTAIAAAVLGLAGFLIAFLRYPMENVCFSDGHTRFGVGTPESIHLVMVGLLFQ